MTDQTLEQLELAHGQTIKLDFQSLAEDCNVRVKEWKDECESCGEDCDEIRTFDTIDVLQYLAEINLVRPNNIIVQNGMEEVVHDKMLETIVVQLLGDDFDPWPGLTEEYFLFLVGDRHRKRTFPCGLWTGTNFSGISCGLKLTQMNKLVASWHREYLEQDLAEKTFKASGISKEKFFLQVLDEYINCPMSIKTQDYKRFQNSLAFACGQVWSVSDKIPQLHWSDVQDAIQNGVSYDQWIKTGRTYSGAARRIRPIILETIETKAAA